MTTKADIVESIYMIVGISKKESDEIVDDVFETIKAELERGESVKLSGFGNFDVRSKSSRVGRNPKTGEAIEITARKVVTFKPSTILRAKVNGERKR